MKFSNSLASHSTTLSIPVSFAASFERFEVFCAKIAKSTEDFSGMLEEFIALSTLRFDSLSAPAVWSQITSILFRRFIE